MIYVIGSLNGISPVKIGYTTDAVGTRLSHVQQGNWVQLAVLAHLPGGRADEHDLHRRFAAFHVRGEWFDRTPEVNAFIAQHSCEPIVARKRDSTRTNGAPVSFGVVHFAPSGSDACLCRRVASRTRTTVDGHMFQSAPRRCRECSALYDKLIAWHGGAVVRADKETA